MRCPKCNYISFDEMEICGGCKKNISKYSKVLHGVIFKAETPDFLWLQKPEEAPEEEEVETAEAEEEEIAGPEEDDAGLDMGLEAAEVDDTVEFAADGTDEMELDLDSPAADEEPQEIEFDLEADAADSKEQKKPQEMELELPQEDESPELDFSLDSGGAEADEQELPELSMDGLDDLDMQLDDASSSLSLKKETSSAPKKAPPKQEKAAAAPEASLDLDEFDLSGLMPPSGGQDEHIEDLGGLSLESAESADAGKGRKKDKKPDGEQEFDMLSDLSIDGLDLDAPILPPASSAAGKKMRPAAKTGTALDSFDIDIGDLLGGSEKK